MLMFTTPSILDDRDGNHVGNELALVDVRLREFADLGAVFDVRTEDISRGNMNDVIAVGDHRRLRALACAGRAEKNKIHIKPRFRKKSFSVRLSPWAAARVKNIFCEECNPFGILGRSSRSLAPTVRLP